MNHPSPISTNALAVEKISPQQEEIWPKILLFFSQPNIPQSIILIGPTYIYSTEFIFKIAAILLCSEKQRPCYNCQGCRLAMTNCHPDFHYIEPSKTAQATIKIDQIRDLQHLVYKKPLFTENRLIFVSSADKMNQFAANSFLKLLEEPPENLIIILSSSELTALPATIISRCQRWNFSYKENSLEDDYLSLVEKYGKETAQGKLFQNLEKILEDMLALVNRKISVCEIATKWLVFDFKLLIWLLYLIIAEMINCHYKLKRDYKVWSNSLSKLSQLFSLRFLFRQLDLLIKTIKNLSLNLNLNENLVLENWLLAFYFIKN